MSNHPVRSSGSRTNVEPTEIDWGPLLRDCFRSVKILVTGGAGFIGSHLVRALVELGGDVVCIDDLSNGSLINLGEISSKVRLHVASVLDEHALEKAMAGCRLVFHLAALGSVPRSLREPERYFSVNVGGTVRILEAARKVGAARVIYSGSSSAYGDPPMCEAKREALAPLPRSPYAATKLAGEHAMRAWSHSYGLDTAVLRYFNVFGPRQNAHSAYAAVIAAFAKSLNEGRPGVIYGDGEQTRDFTFVTNVVFANLLAAQHPAELQGEVFNIATGGRVSLNELHDKMASLFGLDGINPCYEPARSGDVRHSQANVDKARDILRYEPVTTFEDGLRATVHWYRHALAADAFVGGS